MQTVLQTLSLAYMRNPIHVHLRIELQVQSHLSHAHSTHPSAHGSSGAVDLGYSAWEGRTPGKYGTSQPSAGPFPSFLANTTSEPRFMPPPCCCCTATRARQVLVCGAQIHILLSCCAYRDKCSRTYDVRASNAHLCLTSCFTLTSRCARAHRRLMWPSRSYAAQRYPSQRSRRAQPLL